ncbi:MAG TPA: helix-turn-helix transcriptional regulator [Acholeplasmataceae bacterium]|jgi:LuxR family transcriptional regulator of spore coat protein|nr:helix-turn-helix transcriptional regulator [Acholeplasmataceae bacterium]
MVAYNKVIDYGGISMQSRRFLTVREREIFELLIKNNDTDEIAEKLGISSKTVRNHISNVIQKLGVKGRSQAILELIKMKELELKQDRR